MLANYYDLSKAHEFDNTFGQLYIGKHPTEDRSSLLVLLVDFSGISAVHPDQARKELHDTMLRALRQFLETNKRFLGYPTSESLLCDDSAEALENVLVRLLISISTFLAHYFLFRSL
jgi:Predicted AAA-ATPase